MPPPLFFAFLLPQGVAPLLLSFPLPAGLDGTLRLALFPLGLEGLLRLGAGEPWGHLPVDGALLPLGADAPLQLRPVGQGRGEANSSSAAAAGRRPGCPGAPGRR